MSPPLKKTIVQCDFDGTVTEEDISFLLLDAFGEKDWRKYLDDYKAEKLTVGEFNRILFSAVKEGKDTLLDFLKKRAVKIRPGFRELLAYCRQKGYDFIVTSNGLDFYIDYVLKEAGLNHLRVFAARTTFKPEGLEVKFFTPDGRYIDDHFKTFFTRRYREQGYRVIYIGDGSSDIYPAREAHHTFARGSLLELCREERIPHTPFEDFNDVIGGLKKLALPGDKDACK